MANEPYPTASSDNAGLRPARGDGDHDRGEQGLVGSAGLGRWVKSVAARARARRRSTGRVRAILRAEAVGVALLAVSLAGWAWWSLRHRGPIHQHWEAVERGRFYLERGRPDMALQAVSEVRDEAAGAGEAMAVAG